MSARLQAASRLSSIDRTRRSQTEGVEMSSLAMKRVVATALAGATIASAIGAPAVSADSQSVPPPPSSIAAPAGKAYEDLRADSQSVPPPPSSIAAPAGKAYEQLRAPDQVPTQPTSAPEPVADEPSGFDLPSAAIGAATGAGVVILLLAAGGLLRRRPLVRGHDAVGA